jgi:hypothetical protein|tara:strand:+ start:3038 stop:4000 length:963 start_codon:yes stop_codon:yes gene_type:complete
MSEKHPIVRQHKMVKIPRAIRVPSTVKVIIQPSKAKVVKLNEINKHNLNKIGVKEIEQLPPAPAAKELAAQHVVQYSQKIKKKVRVNYVDDPEITQKSRNKIVEIRGIGINRILVIIGNGPSITEVALEELIGIDNVDIMSINKPDLRIWPTTYWTFCDSSQYMRHEDLWNEYEGIIVNSTAIRHNKPNSFQIKNIPGKGFSRDLTQGFHIGRSTVFASMQVAMWAGYQHTYVFGCDMDPAGLNGQLHFYGTNPDVNPDIRKIRFKNEAEYYDYAATILTDEEKSKFTFCSDYNSWDFVDQFNVIGHKNAVAVIIDRAQK